MLNNQRVYIYNYIYIYIYTYCVSKNSPYHILSRRPVPTFSRPARTALFDVSLVGKKMASVSGVKPAGELQQIVHRIWFWLMFFVPKFPTHLLDFMKCYIYIICSSSSTFVCWFSYYIYIYYIYIYIHTYYI